MSRQLEHTGYMGAIKTETNKRLKIPQLWWLLDILCLFLRLNNVPLQGVFGGYLT